MFYYGLYQHQRGTMTTFNDETLDRLHKFTSRATRDAWADLYPRASRITAKDANEFAKRFYKMRVSELTWIYPDDDEIPLDSRSGMLGSEHEAYTEGQL